MVGVEMPGETELLCVLVIDLGERAEAFLVVGAAVGEPVALFAAGLAQALRDSLSGRAALEQRLAQHDAVHGRLDGLTPRLLLQRVSGRSPNALLSVRSGRLTFEFSIADGRPVHACWYDGDRVRGEGKAVLAPFLGVRAGRFSVVMWVSGDAGDEELVSLDREIEVHPA